MLLGCAEDGLYRLDLGEQDHRQNTQRENGVALSDEELQAPDRGVPGHVERFDPIDCAGGHQDDIDEDADTAEVFELDAPPIKAGFGALRGISISLKRP